MISILEFRKIIEVISFSDVTVVISPVPLYDLPIEIALSSRSLETYPRIIMTLSSFSDILSQMMQELNPNIVIGTSPSDLTSQIVYTSPDHLWSHFLSSFKDGALSNITWADVLIIDEQFSYLLDLWSYLRSSLSSLPRLVIMAQDSSVPRLSTQFPQASFYQLSPGPYPVEIRTSPFKYPKDSHSRYSDMARLIYHLCTEEEFSFSKGDILALVPGLPEVFTLFDLLQRLRLPTIRILALSPDLDNIKLFLSESSSRRVIVSPILIPHRRISIIVDAGLEFVTGSSWSGGRRNKLSPLRSHRLGHLGYLSEGLYYLFQSKPEDPIQPSYFDVWKLLQLLNVGKDPSLIFPSPEVSFWLTLIRRLGTPKIAVPLSIRNAIVLSRWIDRGYPIFPAIAILSMIDCFGPPYWTLPQRQPDQDPTDYRIEVFTSTSRLNFLKGYDDVDTLTNLWNAFMEAIGGPDGRSEDIVAWATRYGLSPSKLREVLFLVKQCVDLCRKEGLECDVGPFETKTATNLLRPLLAEVYGNLLLRLSISTNSLSYLPVKEDELSPNQEYTLDTFSVNELKSHPPPFLLPLLVGQFETSVDSIRVILLACALDKNSLEIILSKT